MHFEIEHVTTYSYSRPVHLGPHVLRLTPRCDGSQQLLEYSCEVFPRPSLQASALDAEGNVVTRLWFIGETPELRIASTFRLETLQDNPYDYLLETPATRLPMPYNEREAPLLAPYRYPGTPSAKVITLAMQLARRNSRNTLAFLNDLNDMLHGDFEREIRPSGPPQPPEVTLERGRGACRDLAVLFITICRLEGIAARFVSGYQARAETERPRRYLHAWPEVYLPGGGWRGYDPSHGSAVANAHVAVAAACSAADAAPIEGSFYGSGATSGLEYTLDIYTHD
jgi:transglutaminase-like putative cysteine protease